MVLYISTVTNYLKIKQYGLSKALYILHLYWTVFPLSVNFKNRLAPPCKAVAFLFTLFLFNGSYKTLPSRD